jgi:hypothetical protein
LNVQPDALPEMKIEAMEISCGDEFAEGKLLGFFKIKMQTTIRNEFKKQRSASQERRKRVKPHWISSHQYYKWPQHFFKLATNQPN